MAGDDAATQQRRTTSTQPAPFPIRWLITVGLRAI